MTIDSILSFIITVPPTTSRTATTIVATRTEHSDLFWALCGGGGNNFGIISQITYELFEVDDVIAYTLTWPFEEAKKVIDIWHSTSTSRPNAFTEEINIFCKSGVLGISVDGSYVIPKGQTHTEAVTVVSDTLAYMGGDLTLNPTFNYSKQYKEMVHSRVYNNFSILQGVFTNTIDSDFIVKSIIEASKLSGDTIIEFELLGGKVQEGVTGSFGFRDSKFFLNANCNWSELVDTQAHEGWLNDFTKEIVLSHCNGVYLGFPIAFTNIPHTKQIYYGKHYSTLRSIRDTYDPEGVLVYSGTI